MNRHLLTAGLGLLLLSSCYDNSSPRQTLRSLAAAVQKSDMKAYQSLLSDSAASQYGNAQGMEVLRSKGWPARKNLRLSRETLLSHNETGARSWENLYAVSVFAGSETLADTEVFCSSHVRRERGPDHCSTSCVDTERGRRCYRTCTPGFDQDVTDTRCTVSQIRLK